MLLVVLWASVAGPVNVSTRDPSRLGLPTPPAVSSSLTPTPSASPPPTPARHTSARGLGWIGQLADVVLAIGLCAVAFWLLHRWYDGTSRRRRPAAGSIAERRERVDFAAPLDAEVDGDVVRATLAERYADQVDALTRLPPRNGIVQSWVLFEEAAGKAGVARARAETTTEFVVRLLHLLDIDPAAVGRLRALYVEARFSSHEVGAVQRDQARRALDAIHRDLDVAAPAASPSGAGA